MFFSFPVDANIQSRERGFAVIILMGGLCVGFRYLFIAESFADQMFNHVLFTAVGGIHGGG